MAAPEPIAQGNLHQTPLAHVLLKVLGRELDGTLALWRDDGGAGQDRVLFEKGKPVAARLMEGATSLDRGLLPLFRRVKAPYAFYPSDLVGDAVTVRGRVDPYMLIAASLRGGARKEIVDQILGRFGNQRLRVKPGASLSRFGFIPKERAFLELLRAEPQSVGELVQRAGSAKVARRTLYLLAITQNLDVFAGAFVKKSLTEQKTSGAAFSDIAAEMVAGAERHIASTPSDELPLPDFDLPPSESSEREDPTGSMPLEGMRPSKRPPGRRSVPPRSSVRPSGRPSARPSARPSGRPTADSGPPPPKKFDIETPPPPPPGLGSELETAWQELTSFARSVHDMNYFEMLGLAKDAGADAVRDAYFERVKKWHPDRLQPELKALSPWNDQIFHHLSEAERTLSDEGERSKYIKSVQGGGGTPREERKLSAILSAAMEFQKVEVLLRRKHYDEADKILDEILELAPDEADYLATKGLIIWRQHGSESSMKVEEALKWLQRALKVDERNERALVTQAKIFQRQGKDHKALELYRMVVSINPKNLDAARQVRIAAMRGGDTGKRKSIRPKDDGGGGLFSKLFGKKK